MFQIVVLHPVALSGGMYFRSKRLVKKIILRLVKNKAAVLELTQHNTNT